MAVDRRWKRLRTEEVYQAYQSGMTYKQLAEKFQVRVGTISYHVLKVKRKKMNVRLTGKRKERNVQKTETGDQETHYHIAYAAGRVEGWLDAYAEGNRIPRAVIAEGVARFLQRKASR